jgi:hypothetical protein
MSRGIDSSTQAELDKSGFNIINLMEFQGIGGVDTYITDAPIDITYNSNVYQSLGVFLSMTDIMEEEDIKIESVDITLSAIDTDLVKLFLDYDYIDRRVVINRAVMGHDYSIIGSPILVFDGRLDQPRVVEDFEARKATLAISASSHWSDFEAIGGRHTNDTEHQVLYSGDDFFAPGAETQKDVKWGKE